MKKLKICSIISLATISLFGCAGNQKDNALDNRDHDNIRNVRYEGNQTDLQRGRNVPNDITNNDTRLHIANKAKRPHCGAKRNRHSKCNCYK